MNKDIIKTATLAAAISACEFGIAFLIISFIPCEDFSCLGLYFVILPCVLLLLSMLNLIMVVPLKKHFLFLNTSWVVRSITIFLTSAITFLAFTKDLWWGIDF
jgi:hypothetical protein